MAIRVEILRKAVARKDLVAKAKVAKTISMETKKEDIARGSPKKQKCKFEAKALTPFSKEEGVRETSAYAVRPSSCLQRC